MEATRLTPVTGNEALHLSVAFDKENWWCDAAVLKTIGSTAAYVEMHHRNTPLIVS